MAGVDLRRGLLARIIAEPDDVALRRVYADALEQRGDPRGTFIHAQCELETASAQRRDELRALEKTLLEKWFTQWVRPVMAHPADVTFVRGFIEHWRCSPVDFIARGARAMRKTPLRRAVISGVGSRELAALLNSASFRNMRELELRGLTTWPFRALAGSSFPRLQRLMFEGAPSGGSSSLEGMLRQLSGLRALGLELPLTAYEISALETSAVLGQLVELRVRRGVPLAPAPLLERFWVSDVEEDDARLLLFLAQHAPRLRELVMTGGSVGPRLVEVLLAAPALAEVTLENCRCSPLLGDALQQRFRARFHRVAWQLARDGH